MSCNYSTVSWDVWYKWCNSLVHRNGLFADRSRRHFRFYRRFWAHWDNKEFCTSSSEQLSTSSHHIYWEKRDRNTVSDSTQVEWWCDVLSHTNTIRFNFMCSPIEQLLVSVFVLYYKPRRYIFLPSRFFGSKLKILPVRNNGDILTGMLTIAKVVITAETLVRCCCVGSLSSVCRPPVSRTLVSSITECLWFEITSLKAVLCGRC